MRKSFKKVLCAVMAASMVFSTPIATNVVAQAASGEEGACVVKDLTKDHRVDRHRCKWCLVD